MIIIGGGGGLALLMLLVFLVLFVVLPIALVRGAHRAMSSPARGWGAYEEPRWEVPREPKIPPVSPGEVSSLRDRLGHDVRTLDPGGDRVAMQALADASERYGTCSALLERADSQAQLRTAWLAAAEGLSASRLVRSRLGLDPGPEIPLPPSGPGLAGPTRIEVDGRAHVGGPTYGPGRAHWFPGGSYGGRYVPAGWYDAPFWPSALVLGGLGALGGLALGGLAAGAMFGDDFSTGDGGWGDGGWGGDGGGGDWGGGWGSGGGDGGGGWGDGGWGGGGDGGGGGWGGGDFGGGDW